MCVFLYLLQNEDQNPSSASKVRTVLESRDILVWVRQLGNVLCVSGWAMPFHVRNATSYLKLACLFCILRRHHYFNEFLLLKSEFCTTTGGVPQGSLLSIDPLLTWCTATLRLKPFPKHTLTGRNSYDYYIYYYTTIKIRIPSKTDQSNGLLRQPSCSRVGPRAEIGTDPSFHARKQIKATYRRCRCHL